MPRRARKRRCVPRRGAGGGAEIPLNALKLLNPHARARRLCPLALTALCWLARNAVAEPGPSSAAAPGATAPGAPDAVAEAAPVVPPRVIGDTLVEYPAGASGSALVVLELVIGAAGEVRAARAI